MELFINENPISRQLGYLIWAENYLKIRQKLIETIGFSVGTNSRLWGLSIWYNPRRKRHNNEKSKRDSNSGSYKFWRTVVLFADKISTIDFSDSRYTVGGSSFTSRFRTLTPPQSAHTDLSSSSATLQSLLLPCNSTSVTWFFFSFFYSKILSSITCHWIRIPIANLLL